MVRLSYHNTKLNTATATGKQESRAIAGRTARCRCKFL